MAKALAIKVTKGESKSARVLFHFKAILSFDVELVNSFTKYINKSYLNTRRYISSKWKINYQRKTY